MTSRLQSRTLRIDPDRCSGHMSCVRVCPVEAIRAWHGKAEMLSGRCIDCGLCIRVCKSGAITPRQGSMPDLKRFRHTVAIPSPALYAQFGRDVTPAQIIAALKRVGFDEVADMTPACEAVLLSIQRMVQERRSEGPLISPHCPTVVRLIQVRHPSLLPLLAPVETPQEVMAQAIRTHRAKVLGLRRDQIAIFHITPCPAKASDLKYHTHHQASQLDGAVAISQIYGEVKRALASRESDMGNVQNGVSGPCLGWALVGGQGGSIETGNSIAVGGLESVIRTLEDIENGKLHDVDYVECRSCREGCVDGCLTVENLYEARNKLVHLIRRRGSQIDPTSPSVRDLTERSDLILSKPVEPRPSQTLDSDRARAIEKMQRMEDLCARLPGIDCAACGAPTCRAFAEDVVQGRVEEASCPLMLQQRLRKTVADLSAILDQLPRPPGGGEGEGKS
ncbi:4Fe-4S binding protein [Candidatus Sumerlaeota bacterium]|nr:4Fe-4S binding protein [Candidatus Sumerlaeota bacterium]